MKILVATGRLAENTVRKAAGEKADVLVADIDIAAFITPKKLIKAFEEANLSKKYDLILVPGLVSGDFSKASEMLDCRIRLGPKHAFDLGFVLPFADRTEFSEKIPACELLVDVRKNLALDLIRKTERRSHCFSYIEGCKNRRKGLHEGYGRDCRGYGNGFSDA